MEINKGKWCYFIVLILLTFASGWLASKNFYQNKFYYNLRGVIIREGKSGLINPIIVCEVAPETAFLELKDIKEQIRNLIEEVKSLGQAKNISVYVRALNSGRWFSINNQEKYAPASLLKVAVMIAYLKTAESQPKILSQKIFFGRAPKLSTQPTSDEIKTLEENHNYTISELIEQMIVYSDNDALDLLIEKPSPIVQNELEEVAKYFHINLSQINEETKSDFMNISDYSLIFRVLYNTTYLNRNDSEYALELLSRSIFHYGIESGLPKDIVLAHKFGVSEGELHDCGIVYYPVHPYFLCIMTKGDNQDQLANVLKKITEKIYREMDIFFKKDNTNNVQ